MNPLMSVGTVQDYYDFDEYDFAALEPGSQASEGALELSEEGIARLAHDMTELFSGIYDSKLLDPVRYIQTSIRQMIDESSASEEVKERVDSKSWIPVDSVVGLPFQDTWASQGGIAGEERRHFRLEEIVTDRYRRKVASEWNNVIWPKDFPEDLVTKLESADLQTTYQEEVEQRLNDPKNRFLWKFLTRIEIHTHLQNFADRPGIPGIYQQLIQDYFDEKVDLELVEFGSRLSRFIIPQVAYLRYPDESTGGLLIFVGASRNEAVVILPRLGRRGFIERSTWLHKLILRRLPLYIQSVPDNDKLRYYKTYMGPRFEWACPLQFRRADDIYDALHSKRIECLKLNMDVLVSSDAERLDDKLLEVGVAVLGALALVASLPAGPSLVLTRAMTGFLAGAGASAIKVLRGTNADYAEDAIVFYNEALADTVKALAGPIAELATGTEHSSDIIDAVVDQVLEALAQ